MKIHRSIKVLSCFAMLMGPSWYQAHGVVPEAEFFNRTATFPVYLNGDITEESAAEIVSATDDGMTLIYTDSENDRVGFVDITDANNPLPAGVLDVGGEPTSVATAGDYVLVAVNTSEDFVNVSGDLVVISLADRNIARRIPLLGQPDSIAVSPDGQYAAIAIENERDEDLGEGLPNQMPAGFMTIIYLIGTPKSWQTREVDLLGLAEAFPNDPEPEYVAINELNVAVVTLQENNHLVIVDLPSGKILNDFSAGFVDLENIDNNEDGLLCFKDNLQGIPREPDGVTWISPFSFATADEGDLFGGSRGFTIFSIFGDILYEAEESNEYLAASIGHYPEDRAENKGVEPENVSFASYDGRDILFVGAERANIVFAYELNQNLEPGLIQILPTSVAPEGILTIPQRNLVVIAAEKDSRDDGFRSSLSIFELGASAPDYPTLIAANNQNDLPMSWGALSGLTIEGQTAYTVGDSAFAKSRIFEMDLSQTPALITSEILLKDTMGLMKDFGQFKVHTDMAVDLDLEGITRDSAGNFWLVTEGAGSVNDLDRPVTKENLLIKANANGDIVKIIRLPAAINATQSRFGLEGISYMETMDEALLTVIFQREWLNDPKGSVRIGQYSLTDDTWAFAFYPIDPVESPRGGWVGLSDITPTGEGAFAVIERDNQSGADAKVKRIYEIDLANLRAEQSPRILQKRLIADLLPLLRKEFTAVPDKVEGLAKAEDGALYILNDNDGLDDSSGETRLLKIK
ncbi:MAG: esterase-like activity of phytase family protein [Pseudobacteriovorax sp.]|nr:esterase-like activity of phytase family protein [Pseudobacteriovorax sp.]